MERSEFAIGLEFWCGDRQWRCTDVGTRTIAAIGIDSVDATRFQDGVSESFTLSRQGAEKAGWFNGPPYGVAELVFDEDDLEGCTLEPDEDDRELV